MSERTDSRMRGNRLLLGVAIVFFTVIMAGGTILWLRQRSNDEPHTPERQDQQLAQKLLHDEPLAITVYYPSDGMLATVSAAVRRQPDTQSQARESLAALFEDPRASQAPVLRDIKLREFYLDPSGTGYIDLALGPRTDVRASAWEERLAIAAMANTLLRNFAEIKQVFLLLDGREAQTLAGHIDLSRAFSESMDLVKE